MNLIITKLICIVLGVIIFILIYFIIKMINEYKQRKNDFIKYLECKNDYQNLIKFGFYNLNGFKENRRVPFLDKLIMEEYQKNTDKTFLDYSVYIQKRSKILLILLLISFVLFCIMTTIMNRII